MRNDILNIFTSIIGFPPECSECLMFHEEAIKTPPCNGDWYKSCENRTDYVEEDDEQI